MDLHLMKNEFLLPDQPRSQGSLLPALPRAGRREPWERGWLLIANFSIENCDVCQDVHENSS